MNGRWAQIIAGVLLAAVTALAGWVWQTHASLIKIQSHLAAHEQYENFHSTCWSLHISLHDDLNELRQDLDMDIEPWAHHFSHRTEALH